MSERRHEAPPGGGGAPCACGGPARRRRQRGAAAPVAGRPALCVGDAPAGRSASPVSVRSPARPRSAPLGGTDTGGATGPGMGGHGARPLARRHSPSAGRRSGFRGPRPRPPGQGRRLLGIVGLVAAGAVAGGLIVNAVEGFRATDTAAVQPAAANQNGQAGPNGGVPVARPAVCRAASRGGRRPGTAGRGRRPGPRRGAAGRGTLTAVSGARVTVRTSSGSGHLPARRPDADRARRRARVGIGPEGGRPGAGARVPRQRLGRGARAAHRRIGHGLGKWHQARGRVPARRAPRTTAPRTPERQPRRLSPWSSGRRWSRG